MAHSASRSKRVWFVALGLMVLVAASLLPDWQRRTLPLGMRPLATPFIFVERTLSGAVAWVRDGWSRYVAVTALLDTNQALQDRVDRLTRERDALVETAAENRRLTELLAFRSVAPVPAHGARVIGRSPSRWYQSIMIGRGSDDGAVIDMGVAVAGGVVGTVVKVLPSASVVLLVTDRQSAVPVVVQRTREQGIVEGTIAGRLRLKYLPPSSEVREGDVLLTSGLTSSFSKGLMVGTVTRVDRPEGALFPDVEVLPSADLSSIEEVVVFDPALDSAQDSEHVGP
ncbi:MAG: rod shape-determining protein MreC [Nitrospirota bacterium]